MNNYKGLSLACLPKVCFYCGEPASDREHVFPKSVFAERGFKVWACSECNTIVEDRIFQTIEDKSLFIRKAIQKKYKRLFQMPDWDIEELEEMGYNMRNLIEQEIEHKERIKKRLQWHTTIPTMLIAKYLENEETPQEEITTYFKDRQRNMLIRDMLDIE